MSFMSWILRAAFQRNDDKRDADLTAPAGIQRFDSIQYGPDETWHVLDVYRPQKSQMTLPVIVSVHGGGWIYGDKERYQYYCMSLAEKGFAVVNFTYRLAPRYRFPAQMEDTNRVFSWVLEHKEPYGFDPQQIFAVGDSAGAQLLGLYCCMCANPVYASRFNFSPPSGFAPKAIALNCGVYHFQKSGRKDLPSRLLADYLPGKGTEEELETISVLNHLTPSFPPSFIMTCEGDYLSKQAPPLVERLRQFGVQVEYRYYGDHDHVLGHVFHCDMRSEDAAKCNDDECSFFISFLPN